MPENNPRPQSKLDDLLEKEIAAALGDGSIEDMLAMDRPRQATEGRQRRMGRIVSIHGDDVFVEFGPKSQGVCPITQFQTRPSPGESLEFIVDRFDRNDGLLILSREGAVRRAEWEALEAGQVIEARCTGVNKGGLDMEVAHHRAFMPAGQVALQHIPDLSVFVGEKMTCLVMELDRTRGRIVLSRRAHLEIERRGQREQILSKLEVGAVVDATIASVQPYGAFADLGGLDGLIHVSDLSHGRVKSPADVVSVGQKVRVKVLKIERDQDPPRLSLGLKQTLEDPFHSEVQKLAPGAVVSGRVTRLETFGAFVELAPGVEGLVHISELAPERVHSVSKIVKPDEIVQVKVLSVDPATRRIALSLKAARAQAAETDFTRADDAEVRRAREALMKKFGGNLKGGLG